jgi:sarcosine oxidase
LLVVSYIYFANQQLQTNNLSIFQKPTTCNKFEMKSAPINLRHAVLKSAGKLAAIKKSVDHQLQHCKDDSRENFDVIVLGVGSMGSSTCYHLARQGIKVLGLEQFDVPNEMGSHTGQSRLIRKAYYEHPDYVPLLERAYHNWKQLENITGMQVYFETGLLYFGRAEHPVMKGVHESADLYGIRLDTLSANDLIATYPQIKIDDDYEKLVEPEAGFLTPEGAILSYTDQALKNGAVIKTNVKVIKWDKTDEGIEVTTAKNTYKAKKLIITAGPWAAKLVPNLSSTLNITRQMMAWVIPNKPELFDLDILPCWTIADDDKPGIYYGFPILPAGSFDGPVGFKIAHHFPGTITDPDSISRIPTQQDEAKLVYALNKYFPEGYKSTLIMKACMYTNTPDENFILDILPDYDGDVVIGTGFSGHGFKFASVVGEVMSDLALKGNTTLPIGFLNAKRFFKNN